MQEKGFKCFFYIISIFQGVLYLLNIIFIGLAIGGTSNSTVLTVVNNDGTTKYLTIRRNYYYVLEAYFIIIDIIAIIAYPLGMFVYKRSKFNYDTQMILYSFLTVFSLSTAFLTSGSITSDLQIEPWIISIQGFVSAMVNLLLIIVMYSNKDVVFEVEGTENAKIEIKEGGDA
jgi:hypothetical protein